MKVRRTISMLILVGSFSVPILAGDSAPCISDCCVTAEMTCGMEIDATACSLMPSHQPVQPLPAVTIKTIHGNILILGASFHYDHGPQYASRFNQLPSGIFVESHYPNVILPLLI